ncbi:MAG: PSD1 and planctomycete cytochrome C domain-containing protein [Verrucomicrobiales bacterium]
MNMFPHRNLFFCIIAAIGGFPSGVYSDVNTQVDFSRDVLPILSNKCFACHGPDTKKKSQLRLDSSSTAMADRDGVRAIDPENPAKSEILIRLHDKEDPMPPEDAEKQLTDKERELLSNWVRQGGKYADHWAFVLPRKQAGKKDIDAFVGARLAAKGVDFAPEADRATLARRVALVLTGLPPEPEQLSRFLGDDRPEAYGVLVEELLANSRYGEHQARYWLDAVRYGDTHGLHLDNRRGIYPYRDWVVKALNGNLPLDDFITWQLAGDLLPDPTLEQRVATGFVRMNPSTAEGGAIPDEFQAKNTFDRTETLGTVLLGMTLTCARCHTHKYDPIKQVEYYRLYAFFNNTAEGSMDGNKYDYAPVMKAPADGAQWREWQEIENQRDAIIAEAGDSLKNNREEQSPAAEKWQASGAKDRLKMITDPNGPWKQTVLSKRATDLVARVSAAEKKFTTTLVAQDRKTPRVTKMLRRGEYNLPFGDSLKPDVPEIMNRFPEGAPRNRLGLAQWLTAPDQPLVPRVLVNRVWQRVFGHGLVRTPEDFGVRGEQPTHPGLLDWLAVELQDSGWDLKHLLRLMVHSRTFRQDSKWRGELNDPENHMLARGQNYRMDAEMLRDVALWASGLLVATQGGEGAKPYQPKGMWSALMHPGSNTKNYVRDKGERLYRRSVYTYWKRTSPHPMMTLFDAPARESSCVKRSRSNTALQSLGLLNETQRIEMSRKLAERLLRLAGDDNRRVDYLFGLLACRKPTAAERSACMGLLQKMGRRYGASEADALALLASGEAARDRGQDPKRLAVWTQLAATVLASDVAILIY